MEVKVNEYVRTTNKGIKRIDNIDNNKTVNKYLYYIGEDWDGKCYGIIKTTEIVRHSTNIKELVQAGDLIKIPEGIYEVIFDESYEKLGILVPNRTCLSVKHMSLEYIFEQYKNVGILTKEQFNSMKFIVGDESNVKD